MLMDVQHAQRGQPVFRHGVSKWRLDLFIYLFFLLLFSGTQLRICVQVATPLAYGHRVLQLSWTVTYFRGM